MIPRGLKKEIKNRYHDVIQGAGRIVYIYSTPDTTDCPNCLNDISTGMSIKRYDSTFTVPTTIYGQVINPISFIRGRCPVCKDAGVISQDVRKGIRAVVRWNPVGDEGSIIQLPVGREGSNLVSLKTSKDYYDTIRECIYASIDGIKCELVKPPVYRYLQYTDALVIAYFISVDEGKSTRD